MTKENKTRLRKIYKVLLSASIILAGICLIIGCVSIYFSGNGYSSDIIAKTFSKINIPVYFCLALIVGDAIWELISPTAKKHIPVNKKSDNTPTPPENKKLNIIRSVVLGIAVIALVLGAVFGGYVDVLTKAAKICTECIGLG